MDKVVLTKCCAVQQAYWLHMDAFVVHYKHTLNSADAAVAIQRHLDGGMAEACLGIEWPSTAAHERLEPLSDCNKVGDEEDIFG